jgi:hypothetical protein
MYDIIQHGHYNKPGGTGRPFRNESVITHILAKARGECGWNAGGGGTHELMKFLLELLWPSA